MSLKERERGMSLQFLFHRMEVGGRLEGEGEKGVREGGLSKNEKLCSSVCAESPRSGASRHQGRNESGSPARSAPAAAMMHSDVYGLLLLCERQGITKSEIFLCLFTFEDF